MKYLLIGLTSNWEIREVLREATKGVKQADLYEKLKRKFPEENWTLRILSNMLSENGSVSIDHARANQIMEIMFPEEKHEFSLDQIKDRVDEIISSAAVLRQELIEATKKDKTIDTNELRLLNARANFLNNLVNKFTTLAQSVVNVQLH